jgi:thiol-disulfide isomerase/thioredoxin
MAALLLAGGLAGCDDDKKTLPTPPQGKRSEVVQATAPTAPATAAAPTARPAAPRPPLCATAPAAAGRSLPGGGLPHLEAPGTAPLAGKIPTGGRWTWVNLWAAWCKPCKEEIPLLRSWEAQLAQGGTPIHLAFLSLDDDERQARRFLEAQPASGLRASWWLEEGKGRLAWLEALNLRSEPQLPVHLLFDPQGALRCVIEGAIEPGDLPSVRAVVARR